MLPVRKLSKPEWATLICMALLFLLKYAIAYPLFLDIGIEPSFTAVLHESFAQGKQFGRDIVYSYGPLGFLSTPLFHPDTHTAWVTLHVILCLLMAIGLFHILEISRAPLKFFIPATFLALMISTNLSVAYFPYLLYLGYLVLSPGKPSTFIGAILTVCLTISSLSKFSYLLAALTLIIPFSLFELMNTKKAPVQLIVWTGLGLLLWLVSGQEFTGIWAYITSSIEVTAGYSEAMALWPSGRAYADYIALITSSLLLCYLTLTGNGTLKWVTVKVITIIAFGFMIFKASFVRHDYHALYAHQAGITISLICVLLCSARAIKGLPFAFSLGSTVVATLLAITSPYQFKGTISENIGSLKRNLTTFVKYSGHPEERIKDHELARSKLKYSTLLPPTRGTSDIYPWDHSILYASNKKTSIRPVFQSYTAYTKKLAQINVDHLKSPQAPDNVFFAPRVIDGRLPTLGDGPSYLEMLKKYYAQGNFGEFIWLKKRRRNKHMRIKPVLQRWVRMGEKVDLHRYKYMRIFAEIKMFDKPFGKLAKFIHKSPESRILINGEQDYRFIPGMGEAGFLINPLIRNGSDFVSLFKRRRPRSTVQSFALYANTRYYKKAYHLRLFRIDIR